MIMVVVLLMSRHFFFNNFRNNYSQSPFQTYLLSDNILQYFFMQSFNNMILYVLAFRHRMRNWDFNFSNVLDMHHRKREDYISGEFC